MIGLTRVLFAAALSLAAVGVAAAPGHAATAKGGATPCLVRGTPAQLDIHCQSATLSQLLGAIRQATGLRADYPDQLASARVSTVLRRATLAHALESALAAFNFAVWRDEQQPAATHVSVLGMRGPTDPQEAAADRASVIGTETVAAATAGAPAATRRSTVKRNEDVQTPGGLIPAASPRGNDQAPPQHRPELAPRSSDQPLEAVRPSAFLLAPPATGSTPLVPQRADGPILSPVLGNGQR